LLTGNVPADTTQQRGFTRSGVPLEQKNGIISRQKLLDSQYSPLLVVGKGQALEAG